MLAILGGLGAAAMWAVSVVCSSRSSRLIEPMAVVAWVMLVGLVVAAPLAAVTGVPTNLHGPALVWLVLSGAGNVGGLIINYYALRIGQVSLVAPIVSTEGAIAAIIAVLAGQSLAASVAVALLVIVIGVVLASVPPRARADHDAARHPTAVILALTSTVAFGVSLYATGRAGAELPASWVVLSARLIGAVALALPLALAGRLRLTSGRRRSSSPPGSPRSPGSTPTCWGPGTVWPSPRCSPPSSPSWRSERPTCCSASG